MIGTIKVGAIIGASYGAGAIGGAWIADHLNVKSTQTVARKAIQIGTGVVAFAILSSVLA